MIQSNLTGTARAVKAVQELGGNIRELSQDPNNLGFFTAVNIESGRAKMVPIPTRENFEKIVRHYSQLPANIKARIESNMPEGGPKALKTLIDELSKEKALQEKPENKPTED